MTPWVLKSEVGGILMRGTGGTPTAAEEHKNHVQLLEQLNTKQQLTRGSFLLHKMVQGGTLVCSYETAAHINL